MADPALAIQGAHVSALQANPALCGGRVYDKPPANPTYPYIQVGDGDTVGDDNDCFDASEFNAQVHVWSQAAGLVEVKQIAADVRARLRTEFVIAGFVIVEARHVITRYLRDPDGISSHAVVEFRYLVDHDT